jgi:hypothetical protein
VAEPPPDFPDWIDERTVRWCAERCSGIAARAIGKNRCDYHGALTCGLHLKRIADRKSAKLPVPINA